MITEQELKKCITEIGLLALSTSSCVTRKMTVYEAETIEGISLQWFPSAKILATANALLELAKVVKDNWDAIQQRPLKTFSTQIAPMDTRRGNYSPVSLIQAKLNPSKKQTLGITRIESYQCTENEFLCYILEIYLQDLVNGIADILESLTLEKIVIPYIPQRFQNERPNFMAVLQERIEKRNSLITDEKKRIVEIVLRLRDCAEWAAQLRESVFLENVLTPDEPPSPSLRLTGSPTYGAIFEQYSHCRAGSLVTIEKVLYLYECSYRGQIRPTWEIYTMWCIARLYSTFILYANMQPPNGEPTIFECIRPKGRSLELPKNRGFKLVGSLNNGQQFRLTFWYQPELKTESGELKIPDIKVVVSTSGDRGFNESRYGWYNSQQVEAQYCFNIKDRNYSEQGAKQFTQDFVETYNTYLASLRMKASFIIHTDNNLDYWGEVDLARILREEFNVIIEHKKYLSHRYGTIALLPTNDVDRQFKKIVQLLFKYHNDSLKTACLACGHQLEWLKDVLPSWIPSFISESELIDRVLHGSDRAGSATGVYCSCPKCGDVWVVQLCYGSHHTLIKLIDCFHRNSDHPEFFGKWMYICPVCGSDPSLAQIMAARNAGF